MSDNIISFPLSPAARKAAILARLQAALNHLLAAFERQHGEENALIAPWYYDTATLRFDWFLSPPLLTLCVTDDRLPIWVLEHIPHRLPGDPDAPHHCFADVETAIAFVRFYLMEKPLQTTKERRPLIPMVTA